MENWRVIPGTDGIYWASDAGRIKRVGKIGARTGNPLPDKILSPTVTSLGHRNCKVGSFTLSVGRAVYSAWKGRIKAGENIKYIDGDLSNNALSNLTLTTRQEIWAEKSGKNPRGNRHFSSEESAAINKWIMENPNASCADVNAFAVEFGCSPETVRRRFKKLGL